MSDSQLPPPLEVSPEAPDRNLALELVRVTEAAAMAAGRWVGRGDKNGADGAAVNAMRTLVSTVSMNGVVVIGEGEKDEAPMLFNGEEIGSGGPACDIAVDPIDGTTLTSLGRPNAIAVIALSERGTMFNPGPCVYMEKIAAGPEAADAIDITASVKANLKWVAKALRKDVADVTAVILDRDRHSHIIKECREAGARIRLIPDGDVAGAISTAWPESGADILITTDSGTPRRRALVTKLRLRSWNQTPVSFTALHARRNTLRMSFHASSVSGLVKTQSLLMCRGWASSASRNRRQLISAPARRPPRWWPSCLCPRARGCGSGTRNVRASARRTGS